MQSDGTKKRIHGKYNKKNLWQKARFVHEVEIKPKNVQMGYFCAIITPTEGAAGKGGASAAAGAARSRAVFRTKEGRMMTKPVKVTCFKQVHNIVTAAAQCRREISVQDLKGAVADAKSILGLMNLDFSQPVEICGEDPAEVERVYNAVRH